MDQTSVAMLGQAQGVNQNLGALVQAFKSAFPLSAYTGSFTMAAAATKTVTDAHCKAASLVVLIDTNAAAGTLQGSAKRLYVAAGNGSFVVSTASGAAAVGTETFSYLIVNTGT